MVSNEKLSEKHALKGKQLRKWYYATYSFDRQIVRTRIKVRHFVNILAKPKSLPKFLNFIRWLMIDFLRAKKPRFWGIYQFVAMPGEGKTMSMVAHMERALEKQPDLLIGTNFNYKHQHYQIEHWSDMIKLANEARRLNRSCIVALDEIHITFDSANWQSFPPEMLALLSFNRKVSLQFLCSSQIYERIPKKVRDIANYTVICKNFMGSDRWFFNYYYHKADYEATFDGTKKKAQFIKDFIADDAMYALYDTLEQIDNMKLKAGEEKKRREEAFELLFGKDNDREEVESPVSQ